MATPPTHSTWLLCVAGQDDPELVRRLIETLALCEGEIQEQKISALHGRLTGLIQVRLPDQHAAHAWAQLQQLSAQGLHLLCRDPVSEPIRKRPLTLHIQGAYRVGLDHEIRLILESHRVQVDHYNQRTGAPGAAGTQPFQTLISGRTDAERFNAQRLQLALSRLARGLQIDLQFNDAALPTTVH